jgi:hypothetical protein
MGFSGDWRKYGESDSQLRVALRTCRVTCRDIEGIEDTADVSSESLYEAVARGLAAFRNADWVSRIGSGQTTIKVVVKQPEVAHTVRMRDFEAWLDSNGRSPAEMALMSRWRKPLGQIVCVGSRRTK